MAESELGVRDMFRTTEGSGVLPSEQAGGRRSPVDNTRVPSGQGSGGVTARDTSFAAGWGKGPRTVDERKFKYDRNRSVVTGAAVHFSSSKADRMDPDEAGDVLAKVHKALGIQHEVEERIEAFDNALFFEHYLNGASMLQPGRGTLTVDGQKFDIASTLAIIGEEQLRRFFRAYADDVVQVVRDILDRFDPYDFDSRDKVGQIRQIAANRGLSKFPEYAADSADACLDMSADVRRAVAASKMMTLPKVDQTAEFADSMLARQRSDA